MPGPTRSRPVVLPRYLDEDDSRRDLGEEEKKIEWSMRVCWNACRSSNVFLLQDDRLFVTLMLRNSMTDFLNGAQTDNTWKETRRPQDIPGCEIEEIERFCKNIQVSNNSRAKGEIMIKRKSISKSVFNRCISPYQFPPAKHHPSTKLLF